MECTFYVDNNSLEKLIMSLQIAYMKKYSFVDNGVFTVRNLLL